MYCGEVNGLDLFLLGRRLMKLGERAIPPSGFHQLPTSVRTVMIDVFEHAGTSIQEITERTGFPQSHVSASVARLREAGVLVTTADPADRRRTLVRQAPDIPARARRFSAPIDETIATAIGTDDPAEIRDVVATLEALARRLDGEAAS
jgi:DNA-binding MarR family transcriptional regulator